MHVSSIRLGNSRASTSHIQNEFSTSPCVPRPSLRAFDRMDRKVTILESVLVNDSVFGALVVELMLFLKAVRAFAGLEFFKALSRPTISMCEPCASRLSSADGNPRTPYISMLPPCTVTERVSIMQQGVASARTARSRAFHPQHQRRDVSNARELPPQLRLVIRARDRNPANDHRRQAVVPAGACELRDFFSPPC